MRCEDFPCCGHELGCCPDFDENGKQLNMVCTCGAKLPVDAQYSICAGCMGEDYGAKYNDEDEDDCDHCGNPHDECDCDLEYDCDERATEYLDDASNEY